METKYRFVESLEPDLVGLRLFRDSDGTARGEVWGPLAGAGRNGVDRCIVDPDTAMMAAIRIANCHDVEVVVLGDATLWRAGWGRLVYSETPRPLGLGLIA